MPHPSPRELIRLAPDRRVPNVAVRIRLTAEAQGGVVGLDQLRRCGASSGLISRWIERGWLLRLHPGVYALGHRAISPQGQLRAALLYAGTGSILNHRSAAHHWRLVKYAPDVIHVASPGRRCSIPGVRVHRPRRIVAVIHDGLPVTGVAQTLMDIAPSTPDWELRKALAEADFRKFLHGEDLHAVMGRGHPGGARLRRALQRHMPELARTLSPLEDLFLLLCERYSIPLPTPNARVGPYMPDALWPEAMLIVELDGRAAHSSPDQLRRDAERATYLRGLGYLILRYTWADVVHAPGRVANEVREALRTRPPAN